MSSKSQLSLRALFAVMTSIAVLLGITAFAGWDGLLLASAAIRLSGALLQLSIVLSISLGMFFVGLRIGATALSPSATWWLRPLAGAGSLLLIWFGSGIMYWWLVTWL